MPLYGGIDLHANNSVIVLLDEQDQVIYQKRLSNQLPLILDQLESRKRGRIYFQGIQEINLPPFLHSCYRGQVHEASGIESTSASVQG